METGSVAVETPGEYIKSSRMQRFWTGVYIIWLRDFKRFWRDRIRRVAAFIQPLVFLFILGTGLQAAFKVFGACLLYTSDAADDLLCVDLGGRRIIKKKKKK